VVKLLELDTGTFEKVISREGGPTLVDFWAPWCGPCQLLTSQLERLATEYQGRLVVAKLDVDQSSAVAVRYRVMSLPTLIVFRRGVVLSTQVGASNWTLLKGWVESHLK
jgi:thioredoxin 1